MNIKIKEGNYIPEYNAEFGRINMYIDVKQGACLTEWIAMNTLFPIIGSIIPAPYSYMFSAISDLLMQEHPGAQGFTGSEILLKYTISVLRDSKLISNKVATAAAVYFAYNDIVSGTLCTDQCYNITIVMKSDETAYGLHQISYHFWDGVETLARHSEYNLTGDYMLKLSAVYHDKVNNREYTVYNAESLDYDTNFNSNEEKE